MLKCDVTLLTDARYIAPEKVNDYIRNVLTEDHMVAEALKKRGLVVHRVSWDDAEFDWASTRYVLFRTTWDYFDRYNEFMHWLERISGLTRMINPESLIKWNLDKHYLRELAGKGIDITPTLFIEQGDERSLMTIAEESGWADMILKPAISGAARHTYRLRVDQSADHDSIFRKLISGESMLLQPFQQKVLTEGELAFMVMGGKFTHAILKKARPGDFRVQDDFGGTVHDHRASAEEIAFAEKVVSKVAPLPIYARVDAIPDNDGRLRVSELELIEPELWFRNCPEAAEKLAEAIAEYIRE